MNCQLCQKESEKYLGGNLSRGMKTQVEDHIMSCADCAEFYRMIALADSVISREKSIDPDTYLTNRIMARIAEIETPSVSSLSPFTRVIRPALIMASMAAAIFIGVLIGGLYKSSGPVFSRPVEMVLMDDGTIESVNILSNE